MTSVHVYMRGNFEIAKQITNDLSENMLVLFTYYYVGTKFIPRPRYSNVLTDIIYMYVYYLFNILLGYNIMCYT